jgi:outer membrane protein assembly factor BamB
VARGRSGGGNRALTPPAVANGRVLAGTADGRIIQWDAETGAVRFEVSVGAPVHWMPIMAKGLIAAGLEGGSLIVFDTGDVGNRRLDAMGRRSRAQRAGAHRAAGASECERGLAPTRCQ